MYTKNVKITYTRRALGSIKTDRAIRKCKGLQKVHKIISRFLLHSLEASYVRGQGPAKLIRLAFDQADRIKVTVDFKSKHFSLRFDFYRTCMRKTLACLVLDVTPSGGIIKNTAWHDNNLHVHGRVKKSK